MEKSRVMKRPMGVRSSIITKSPSNCQVQELGLLGRAPKQSLLRMTVEGGERLGFEVQGCASKEMGRSFSEDVTRLRSLGTFIS